MAIDVVATSTATTPDQCGCVTKITICKPAGTVEGDFLIAVVGRDSNSTQFPLPNEPYGTNLVCGCFSFIAGWNGGFGTVHYLGRIVGPCDPATYTFAVGLWETCGVFDDARWMVALHRVQCATLDWDLTNCIPAHFQSEPSDLSGFAATFDLTFCFGAECASVCGCGCRNYLAVLGTGFSSGAICEELGALFPSQNCGQGYTVNKFHHETGAFHQWMYTGYKALTNVTSEDPLCWEVCGDSIATWSRYMRPTALLFREACACTKNVPWSTPNIPQLEGHTKNAMSRCCGETTFTLAIPAGATTGDLLIAVIVRHAFSIFFNPGPINLGCGCNCCGWSEVDSINTVNTPVVDIFSKKLLAPESGCVTFCGACAFGSFVPCGGCVRWAGQMMRFSNVQECFTAASFTAGSGTIAPTTPLVCNLSAFPQNNLVLTGIALHGSLQEGLTHPMGTRFISHSWDDCPCVALRTNNERSAVAYKVYNHTESQPGIWVLGSARFVTLWTLGFAPEDPPPPPPPPTLIQLCVDQYDGLFGGAGITDICLVLCIKEWKETIRTSAISVGVGLYKNLTFSLNKADIKITIKGILPPIPHESHPLVSGVPHFPDAVDLEEAALLFNPRGAGKGKEKVRLELPLPSGVRKYEGVIEKLTLINIPGTDRGTFTLEFGVAWNPSFPTLRAWNDE